MTFTLQTKRKKTEFWHQKNECAFHSIPKIGIFQKSVHFEEGFRVATHLEKSGVPPRILDGAVSVWQRIDSAGLAWWAGGLIEGR